MDAFESVIAALLQRRGYWTQTSFKVELTRDEKREIGRPSSPRWELDVVGYRGATHELRVVECKSFLDSLGVDVAAFRAGNVEAGGRYKLFFDSRLREVVLRRLKSQLADSGFCRPDPKVILCLAAGKIRGDEAWLADHFRGNGWELWGPLQIQGELKALKDTGYENSVAAVVAKLLLRGNEGAPARSERTVVGDGVEWLADESELGTGFHHWTGNDATQHHHTGVFRRSEGVVSLRLDWTRDGVNGRRNVACVRLRLEMLIEAGLARLEAADNVRVRFVRQNDGVYLQLNSKAPRVRVGSWG